MAEIEKLERINRAIQKLVDKKKNGTNSQLSSVSPDQSFLVNDDDELMLLSRLLSELDTSKEDGMLKQSAILSSPIGEVTRGGGEVLEIDNDEVGRVEVEGSNSRNNQSKGYEEIVKELNRVKRQNFVTHCLLSAMVVLTLAWQLSEVSLILKVKNGVTHPFRSFGSMLAGMLKGNDKGRHKKDKNSSNAEHPVEH